MKGLYNCVNVKAFEVWFRAAAAVWSLCLLPQISLLWPAAVCPACWPTAAWPRPLSSSGVCPEPPAIAATPACAGQNTPVGIQFRLDDNSNTTPDRST